MVTEHRDYKEELNQQKPREQEESIKSEFKAQSQHKLTITLNE